LGEGITELEGMNNVGEGDPAFGDVIGTCCVCTLQAVM